MQIRINRLARFLILLGILVILPSLLACSSGYGTTKTTNTTAPTNAANNSVNISNYAFSPATITINIGTSVKWTNKDSVTHTVTSDTGAFTSGNIATNGTYSYTFNVAGTYQYHCSIHQTMKGTIIVK